GKIALGLEAGEGMAEVQVDRVEAAIGMLLRAAFDRDVVVVVCVDDDGEKHYRTNANDVAARGQTHLMEGTGEL
ncbi:hypothetical protein WDZ92_53555, partial [Nostoc sp. NIES-2111]